MQQRGQKYYILKDHVEIIVTIYFAVIIIAVVGVDSKLFLNWTFLSLLERNLYKRTLEAVFYLMASDKSLNYEIIEQSIVKLVCIQSKV